MSAFAKPGNAPVPANDKVAAAADPVSPTVTVPLLSALVAAAVLMTTVPALMLSPPVNVLAPRRVSWEVALFWITPPVTAAIHSREVGRVEPKSRFNPRRGACDLAHVPTISVPSVTAAAVAVLSFSLMQFLLAGNPHKPRHAALGSGGAIAMAMTS